MTVDSEDVRVDDSSYVGPSLTSRTDPQLFPEHRPQFTGCAVARPVLLNLDGEGREPRVGPAILEIHRPGTVGEIVHIDHADRIINVEQSEHVGRNRPQLHGVEGNHRSALLSPCRTVTNVRSRYS